MLLVVHPGQGRCRPDTAQPAPEWQRAAVCIHGDLVVCGECGELGIIPREGLGHMMALLPEGTTPAQAQELAVSAAPPDAVVPSPQGEDRSGFQAVGPWGSNAFGICKATEGATFTDSTFAANWRNLKAEGKPRGAYHYFHPSLSPVDQAHHFVSVVTAQGLNKNDVLAADVEILVGADGTTLEYSSPHAVARSHAARGSLGSAASGSVIGNSARIFLDTVRSLTGHAMEYMVTYTDLSVGAFLAPVASAGYWLWIAYPGSRFPGSVWPWTHDTTRFWQWEFGGGPGGGDRDAFMGDSAAFHAYFATSPPPPPSPKPGPFHLQSMTGDSMFYLPQGDGAQVAVNIPAAVLGPDGPVVPGNLVLNAQGATGVDVLWGTDAPGNWHPHTLDWARDPVRIPIPADGVQAVKFRRGTNSSVTVTGDWQP